MLANILTLVTLIGLGLLLKELGTNFALGFLLGCGLYHIAHRARYGEWF